MAMPPNMFSDNNPSMDKWDTENLISNMLQDLEITVDRETEFGPVEIIKVGLYWRGMLISESKERLE